MMNLPKVDSLERKAMLDHALQETSGLLKIDSTWWTFNDGGGFPNLYQIDPGSGEILQTKKIAEAKNKDWEAIAFGEGFIFIGDIGNNRGGRKDLSVYMIDTSDFSLRKNLKFKYPEEFGNPDCEAILTRDSLLYFFTKEHLDWDSKVFSRSLKKGKEELKYLGTLNTESKVTAAFSKRDTLYLLGYKESIVRRPIVWKIPWTGSGFPQQELGKAFFINRNLQAEGLSMLNDSIFLISNEKTKSEAQGLWTFELPLLTQ
ncbi:MAG: hypothetical protein HKN16_04425 [Saprospiraceae bacterium]|nr:hypothetical protein [Saprospiraceae bacterium]